MTLRGIDWGAGKSHTMLATFRGSELVSIRRPSKSERRYLMRLERKRRKQATAALPGRGGK